VGSTDSTNTLDLGVTNPNPGVANAAWLVAKVNTAFTSGGLGTLTVAIQDSANNVTFSVVRQTAAIAVADLVAGKVLLMERLPAKLRQYVKLTYTVATAAMTAGKVDAFLTTAPQTE
jgi:hypothetical protein